MVNKKIASEIAVGTVLILAIAVGGIFWLEIGDEKENVEIGTVNPPSYNYKQNKPGEVDLDDEFDMEIDRIQNIESKIEYPKSLNIASNDELADVFERVFSGDVEFNEKEGSVEYFEYSNEFSNNPWIVLNIVSDKYTPGAKFTAGYEGLNWEVNLDKEVSGFKSLKLGTQSAKVLGHLGEQKAQVEKRIIGDKPFAVYDLFFKPGGNWTRYYVTFDEKNNQLVYLTFSFSVMIIGSTEDPLNIEESYNKEGYYENIKYPDVIVGYLNEIELLLGKV